MREEQYARLNYARFPPFQRGFRFLCRLFVRAVARLEVEGVENVPASGGVVLAGNHVNFWLDMPIYYCVIPRRTVSFAAARWKRVPPIGWLLNHATDAIYVHRGQPDTEALGRALTVLRSGGALAIAPEGTVSHDGRLRRGRPGPAYLATMAPAPVVPVASHGQEKALQFWKRLRRVPVSVRMGPVIELPAGRAGKRQLREHTDRIMRAVAAMLPAENRGVYRNPSAGDQDQTAGKDAAINHYRPQGLGGEEIKIGDEVLNIRKSANYEIVGMPGGAWAPLFETLATNVAEAPPLQPRPLDQQGLLDLFDSDDGGRGGQLIPATAEDMRGGKLVERPSLEVIYDSA